MKGERRTIRFLFDIVGQNHHRINNNKGGEIEMPFNCVVNIVTGSVEVDELDNFSLIY